MPSDIPSRWKRLPARERDLLLTLLVDGPASGAELQDRIGGVDGRQAKSQTYQALKRLDDAGLVECEAVDDRTDEYRIAGQGKMLVHRVAEEWEVVLRGK